MSPAVAEAQRSLYGTWRLFLGDASGLFFLGRDTGAFWRSFAAIAVCVVPAFFTDALLPLGDETAVAAGVRGVAVTILCFLALPFVAFAIARAAQRPDRAIPYVIAGNWSAVLFYTVYLPVVILVSTEDSPGVGAALAIVVLLAMLVAGWRMARLVLELPRDVTVALLIVQFLVADFMGWLVGLFV